MIKKVFISSTFIDLKDYRQTAIEVVNKELTLHYIVSSNRLPEKEECSCWFAVDVAHERVVKACQ